MKPVESYRRCEDCDKPISAETTVEYYEKGIIDIKDGVLYLPQDVVKKNHKEHIPDSHIVDISGIYCDPSCLINHVYDLLGLLAE
jgi:hypothetical protein